MKKITAINMAAVIFAISLTACGSYDAEDKASCRAQCFISINSNAAGSWEFYLYTDEARCGFFCGNHAIADAIA